MDYDDYRGGRDWDERRGSRFSNRGEWERESDFERGRGRGLSGERGGRDFERGSEPQYGPGFEARGGRGEFEGRGREWRERDEFERREGGGYATRGGGQVRDRGWGVGYAGPQGRAGGYGTGRGGDVSSAMYGGAGGTYGGEFDELGGGPRWGGTGYPGGFGPEGVSRGSMGTHGFREIPAPYNDRIGRGGSVPISELERERWSSDREIGGRGIMERGRDFTGVGPRNYRRSDERIREDVNEMLTRDPRIDATDIDVIVNNGEVTLAGEVEERSDKRHAEELVERIPGVTEVQNNLKARRGLLRSIFGSDDLDRDERRGEREVGRKAERDTTAARATGAAGTTSSSRSRSTVGGND